MRNSTIAGVGHYVPERVVKNADLVTMMDTSDQWIRERTGIEERRWVDAGDTHTSMGLKATKMALERANMAAEDIQLIIMCSVLSDHIVPGSGCFLQAELELPGVPAIDIRNGCSGFLYGLSIADKFIKTGVYDNALIVGAEMLSTSLDLTTEGRGTAVIFADGAGAAILKAEENPEKGILTTHIHADGRHAKRLWVEEPSPAHSPRISEELLNREGIWPYMDGKFVFKNALVRFPEVINTALEATGYSKEDIDLLVPHQANLRITEAVSKRLGMPMEKIISNIQKYGNTTAATIPIGLSEAWEEDRLNDGALVCLASFGAGFTWASALVRF